MKRTNLKDAIFKIVTSEILISFMVFVIALYFVVNLTVDKVKDAYSEEFWRDVYVEAHGMLFDILIIGTFIFALHKLVESRKERKRNIERWQEEIDDFRGWDDKEAMYRIVGNIKRLNRNNIAEINLNNCYLEKANLVRANLQQANLWGANLQQAHLMGANFQQADLWGANLQQVRLWGANFQQANLWEVNLQQADLLDSNFQEADLWGANLQQADLMGANLQQANLVEADMRNANNITIKQLSKSQTLYKTKLDPELEKEIKEKYPHLLEKPKEETEEEIEDK